MEKETVGLGKDKLKDRLVGSTTWYSGRGQNTRWHKYFGVPYLIRVSTMKLGWIFETIPQVTDSLASPWSHKFPGASYTMRIKM